MRRLIVGAAASAAAAADAGRRRGTGRRAIAAAVAIAAVAVCRDRSVGSPLRVPDRAANGSPRAAKSHPSAGSTAPRRSPELLHRAVPVMPRLMQQPPDRERDSSRLAAPNRYSARRATLAGEDLTAYGRRCSRPNACHDRILKAKRIDQRRSGSFTT